MGIVLKRRDNAPIVKEICSGIIDHLINKKDPQGAKEFAEKCLNDMFNNKYDIKYFLQSRTLKLKESYKDWTKIAHVFLAEKLAIRDPGNKPQSGDRIEFAVIVPQNIDDPKKKMLQGEIIDIPSYIKQNNIPINYIFYMKNQIMKPALQFLKLVDPNAEDMFKQMELKYGNIVIKPKKVTKKIKKVNEEPTLITNKKKKNKKNNNVEDVPKQLKEKKKSKDSVIEGIVAEEPVESIKEKKKKKSKVIEEPIIKTKDSVIEEILVEEPVELTKDKKKKKSKVIETKDSVTEEILVEELVESIKDKKKKKSN